jgi:glycosyltransferase involved in cell wall biosynthesis
MKILFLVNHLNVGGITSYLLTLSSGLKNKGHKVYVASSGGEALSKFEAMGVKCIRVPVKTKNELSPGILLSALILRGIVKNEKIDILHSQSRTTQVLGSLLHKVTGVSHISTCHGFFKRRISRRVYPCWGDKTIAISQQVRQHLMNDFKLEDERIELIHNGIDTERFNLPSSDLRQKAKLSLGLKSGKIIGIIARLSDVKGHQYLIEAMKTVLSVCPRAQLLIAGEGKMDIELKDLVKRLDIQDNVLFLPQVLDTRDILRALDIFVLPSLREGLGLALMEAMSMGLAVIGSNVGGIKTLIKDGVNGILVNPKDSKDIARVLIDLISDDSRISALGACAREYIKEDFSQEKMVLQTEELYLKCLRKTE